LNNTTVVLSGASGMIGSFLVDVVMTRNLMHGLNCTVVGLARNLDTLTTRFQEYAGSANLCLLPVDLGAGDLDCVDEILACVSACQGSDSSGPVDYVIHAASNTHPAAYATDPIGTITTNVAGTQAMLDLAVCGHAQRTLFLSTVEIYGQNRGTEPFTETDLGYIDCNTLRAGYPESKRTGEALCQAYVSAHGLDVVIPRLPRVYGPTMRPDDTKAVSQFLLDAVFDRDIVLKSTGDQLYSYCHVADAASAILICLLRGEPGQAYNVADPSSDIRLKDLAQLAAGCVGRSVVIAAPGKIEERGFSAATLAVMDGSKLARLGWKPLHTIFGGVERTVAVLKEIVV